MNPISRVFLSMTLLVAFAMLAAAARHQPGPLFSEPILVKNSPTNLRAFDVSWNDNSEVTDDLGHVWAGDGDANIIEADDKPGTTIKKNRLDVFDPHNLPNPVKSFPVECSGGLLGLTLNGLTVGPNWQLMYAGVSVVSRLTLEMVRSESHSRRRRRGRGLV